MIPRWQDEIDNDEMLEMLDVLDGDENAHLRDDEPSLSDMIVDEPPYDDERDLRFCDDPCDEPDYFDYPDPPEF